jgi:hypothetical protein
MEKCDAEWIHQHRWLSSMLVLAAVSSNAVDMMRQLRVSDDDKDDRHN